MSQGFNTRERILDAAEELFYNEGLLTVNVDRIAAKASVTKKTLYYYFRSKDDLMAECLVRIDAPTRTRYERLMDGAPGDFSARMHGVLADIARRGANIRWKGCGFSRAAAELAGMPGHPARKAASSHKRHVEMWLQKELEAEGYADARDKSKQLMILIDGLIAQLLLHNDQQYGHAAQRMVDEILRIPA